jgi:flagellar biosynthesis/type III secretory pathway protein FliH
VNIRAFAPTRDFSQPEPEPFIAEEEEVVDDRIDPEEAARLIEAAREEGRREGYARGKAEGEEAERSSIAATLEGRVSALQAEIEAIRAREDELFADLETRTARLMLALLHQLAKRLSEAEAKRLAENVATRAVEAVRGKHLITIRADAENIAALRQVLRLPTDEDAAAHRIVFEEEEDATRPPLEVAWLTGKVRFDPYGFTEAIDEVFTRTLESLTGDKGASSKVERNHD